MTFSVKSEGLLTCIYEVGHRIIRMPVATIDVQWNIE